MNPTRRILKFEEFIKFLKESLTILKKYEIGEDYPWSKEIGYLIDKLIKKTDYLKSKYNYNRHQFSNGFEFNIKIQRPPDINELGKKYNLSKEEINSLFDRYLKKSIHEIGDSIIERSRFFENWSQVGDDNKWLVLMLKSDFNINNIVDDTENAIYGIISNLNYYSNEIDAKTKEKWNKLKAAEGSEFELLRNDLLNDEKFKMMIKLEKEGESVKRNLKYYLSLLDELEKELEEINGIISDFYKNIDTNFENKIKN